MRTRVGYAGGTTRDPTYRSIGDHAEAFQVDYDPRRISFEDLMEIFWTSHDPRRTSWSTQYKAAVFVQDIEQRCVAERSRDRLAAVLGATVKTEIIDAPRFYLAEDYHQKHRLRGARTLMAEFAQMYPRDLDFIDSTAAARVNGYLDGNGSLERLKDEIDSFGLSEGARDKLLECVARRYS